MTYASAVVLVYCQLQLPDLFRLCLHSRQLHILSFVCLGAAFSPCVCVWYTCLGAADMLPYRHVHLIVSECPSLVSPGQQLPLFALNQRLQLVGWFAHAARCSVHALLLYSWIVLQGGGFGVLKLMHPRSDAYIGAHRSKCSQGACILFGTGWGSSVCLNVTGSCALMSSGLILAGHTVMVCCVVVSCHAWS